MLDRMLPGGGAESHPEVVVGNARAAAGVVGLVRQFELDLDGNGHVRFDLAVPSIRWAIEIDVFPTHGETMGRRRDAARDAAAAALGWTTTRVTPDQLGGRLPDTIARLVATFESLDRPTRHHR